MEYKRSLYNLYYEWWKNIDKFLFSLIILLFFIGLFFSLVSTSLIVSDKLDTNDYSFFFKHLIFIILGLFVIFGLSSIDQEKLLKYSIIIFLLSLIFLIINKKKFIYKTILFSPCAASFDNFRNFEERGLYFNKLVKKYLNGI